MVAPTIVAAYLVLGMPYLLSRFYRIPLPTVYAMAVDQMLTQRIWKAPRGWSPLTHITNPRAERYMFGEWYRQRKARKAKARKEAKKRRALAAHAKMRRR